MVTVLLSCTIWQPSVRRAVSMTRVSSLSSRSCTTVTPWHRAASSRARLEMLLEPGRVTLPRADRSGGRSRNSVENMGHYLLCLTLMLQPARLRLA